MGASQAPRKRRAVATETAIRRGEVERFTGRFRTRVKWALAVALILCAAGILACSETPAPTPAVAPTATAPSQTPTPTATATATPTPTPYDPAAERLGALLPWYANPPDRGHASVATQLSDLWRENRQVAEGIALLPWVADGVDLIETSHITFIGAAAGDLSPTLPEMPWMADGLGRTEREFIRQLQTYSTGTPAQLSVYRDRVEALLSLPWIQDDITGFEVDALIFGFIPLFELHDAELAEDLLAMPWLADDLNEDEFEFIVGLDAVVWGTDGITPAQQELGETLLAQPWIIDGIEGEREWDIIGDVFLRLARMQRFAISTTFLEMPWLADGPNEIEQEFMERLTNLLVVHSSASSVQAEHATELLTEPWITDGISRAEMSTYFILTTTPEGSLARAILQWAQPREDDLSAFLVDVVGTTLPPNYAIDNIPPDWAADGITDDEAVLIFFLTWFSTNEPLVDSLIHEHDIRTRQITLPLAGDVTLWVVRNAFSLYGEELLNTLEAAVRLEEEFLGAPFPRTDVLLLVLEPDAGVYGQCNCHYGPYFVLDENEWTHHRVPHEVAHYYLGGHNFTQGWLVEGGAQFIRDHVYENTVGPSMLERRTEMETEDAFCLGTGYGSIRHYNYIAARPGYDRETCIYPIGEYFLLSVYEDIGQETAVGALRELYVQTTTQGDHLRGGSTYDSRSLTEQDIYETFLSHTPPDKRDEFNRLYERLHGGFPGIDTPETPDAHGDEPGAAFPIEANTVIEGAMDYTFDIDYFKLPMQRGEKYRIDVDRPLPLYALQLFMPSGKAYFDHKARYVNETGTHLQWVAGTTPYFYVALINSAGESGPYQLEFTHVPDVPDDHGDSIDSATAISTGGTVRARIEDDFDIDYFAFEAVAGRRYFVDINKVSLEEYRVKLYKPDGTAPSNWIHNRHWEEWEGHSRYWTPQESGTYYVAIEGNRDLIGSYRLSVRG